MQKIDNDYNLNYVFDFEKACSKVEVTLHHLSLFSVCFSFFSMFKKL